MDEQNAKYLIQKYAECEVPAELDLWPTINSQLRHAVPKMRKSPHIDIIRRAHLIRPPLYLRATAGIIALILIGTLIVTAPTAHATFSRLFHQFGLILVERPPVLQSEPIADPGTVIEQFLPLPAVGIAEAQQMVPFHISTPTWLPSGVALRGVVVSPKAPPSVLVSYIDNTPGNELAGLSISMTQGNDQSMRHIPASELQQVSINGQLALYAHGAWNHDFTAWDDTADATKLWWESEGMTYILSATRLNLTQNDMIRIAESLR